MANVPDDEPLLTRWTYEDFEAVYEAQFGLKREPFIEDPDPAGQMDGSKSNVANGSAIEEDSQGIDSVPKQSSVKPPRPPPLYYSKDLQELAENITRDILRTDLDVKWEDIKGLEVAKKLLKEAVVMPIKYPKYFTGLLSPWKGIMLFGPPGTGKTMLAKAVATECNTTFFNISASSIVSKWRGDSEKLIRVLFELARHHAPSTIFLDELDAIISQRGDGPEHEASRRLKTELLIQMDGLTKGSDLVFVLAATNLPWELDSAMLRRLEKRILVPLPDESARRAIFESLIPSRNPMQSLPFDFMVRSTVGYSGSDIRLVCKEASMWPLRRLLEKLEARGVDPLCGEDEDEEMGPVTEEDVERALETTKSSAHAHTELYKKFEAEYGSHTI